MQRRSFLATAAAAPLLAGRSRVTRSQIAVITDEVAKTPAEALAFARQYELRAIELRGVPGAKEHYCRLSEPELKAAAKEFRDAGLKVSFFNTPFLKITLPGTEPLRRKPEEAAARQARIEKDQAQFDRRAEDLRQAIRAAHLLDVKDLRVFTFLRVEEPAKVEQRIVEIIGELAELAAREKVRLLVENESACNVVSCREVASFLKLLPQKSVALNWDPLNGTSQNEMPFPDGYALLDKTRIGNVQMKGHSLLDPAKKLDWAAIFAAMSRDGYRGHFGLETHYFDGTVIEKSHASMKEIYRLVEPT